ncbi:response regulator transcription factor [Enterobacter cloacae]|uniref:response regulator transcription factor n=1 Tax=Enterobacter cloacae TaxID=550 RepID=UPI0028E7C5AE|nr:response regulator transcription factor [Enterobacter cloacae]WNT37798.1 response regulator transcription factor [Enterobacter cloacae]HDR2754107.1 response regulator transcription factor [Enterobacter asburiae]HDR2794809.1 response regulator transcription factor [Enterobacter asburiae]HDR2800149.1 response regulator transcription factor [Enterobacter asburiae]
MTGKKIIVMDSSPLLRAGLQGLLSEQGYQVVAQFGTMEELLNKHSLFGADLIIMEHLQQQPDVFSSLAQLIKNTPLTQVLVLSSSSSDFHIQLSRKAGAAGYLNKRSELDNILSTVNKIVSGQFCYGNELRMHRNKYPRDASLLLSLSHIDICILHYISAGYSNQVIAAMMNTNNKRVSAYKKRIMVKFNISKLTELVELAKRNYLY